VAQTYQEIADHFGCAKQSVHEALKPFTNIMKSHGELKTFRDNQVALLESLLGNLTADISDPDKRKKASLNNTAYAYDRIFNSLRLLKGESTENIENAHTYEKTLEEIEAEIAAIDCREVVGMSEEDAIDAEIAELEDMADTE
jgi:hypothetical protein